MLVELFRFLLTNPVTARSPPPTLSFINRDAAPGFRSPPGRKATPAGKISLLVFAAVSFATLAKTFGLGFLLPVTTSPISGIAVSGKFMPTCIATGVFSYFFKGLATRPIRTGNAPSSPPDPICLTGPL